MKGVGHSAEPRGGAGTATNGPRPDTGVAGLLIAGGRSSRFGGGHKALAHLGDRPVVRHVVEALSPVVDEVVINCRRDQRDALASTLGEGVRFALDPVVGRGPVSGLRTALRATSARYAVACACDMPLLQPGILSHLVSTAHSKTGAVAAVEGRIQPLPAVLHVRAARSACTDTLTSGGGTLCELVDRLDLAVVPEREVLAYATPEAFLDVNTLSDLQAAAECL